MAQHHHHDPNHHVQFNCDTRESEDDFGKDNEIVINGYQEEGNTCKLDIHLGFLQVNHRYELVVRLPKDVSRHLKSGFEPDSEQPVNTVHCRIVSGKEDESTGGTVLTLEFFAYKEKLMKEELVLKLSEPKDTVLQLVFHARVLGRGKGTPLLKNGVRSIGIVEDEESEASDWQGFT